MFSLRKLAITLNGEAKAARTQERRSVAQPAVRKVCMPSNGGLSNPDWRWTPGSDLRATFGAANLGGKAE